MIPSFTTLASPESLTSFQLIHVSRIWRTYKKMATFLAAIFCMIPMFFLSEIPLDPAHEPVEEVI